jgi:DNA topoisomerase VI subunit A
LLVEKDAAFMRLAEDRFYNKYPCIILTAKGQPDVATRMFLKRIQSELKLPVLGLVDSDPYGTRMNNRVHIIIISSSSSRTLAEIKGFHFFFA